MYKLQGVSPTTTSTQPNLTSTEVGFDMKMTLHTSHPTPPTIKLKSTRKKGRRDLKFCMRPYLTKLIATKHNLTFNPAML